MADAEKEEFKLKKIRVCSYQQQKKKELPGVRSLCSTYTTKEATGKALKRLKRSLTSSPRKQKFAITKIAQEVGA